MLPDEKVKELREIIANAKRPYFFFDADPDGLAAFLLLYRSIEEGKGYPIKSRPMISQDYVKQVKDYGPDVVFVLDIGTIEQEFVDELKIPIVQIDHHPPQEIKGIKQYNPLFTSKHNTPTSALCYQVVEQDIWIAMVGTINDHFIPSFTADFKKEFPDLIGDAKTIEKIRFETPIGRLGRIFSFNLKGSTAGTLKAIKILTRIKNPLEILHQTTPPGKFIWKRYLDVNKEYEFMREKALKIKPKKGVWVLIYTPGKYSVTGDLADELTCTVNADILILGREKSGEYRCSVRSRTGIPLNEIIEKALHGIRGYGGGHKQACGACINVDDFDQFVDNIRKELQKIKRK